MNIRGQERGAPFRIVPADPAHGEAIADVHLAAWADALPWVCRPHTDAEVRAWLCHSALPRARTWVALEGDAEVVGFLMLAGELVDQLYVRPDRYRRGIGAALLETAKRDAPYLRLFTFARNARARAFYESQGFTVASTSDGERNEEREPDVEYAWSP